MTRPVRLAALAGMALLCLGAGLAIGFYAGAMTATVLAHMVVEGWL